jgi:hypothetical protein
MGKPGATGFVAIGHQCLCRGSLEGPPTSVQFSARRASPWTVRLLGTSRYWLACFHSKNEGLLAQRFNGARGAPAQVI